MTIQLNRKSLIKKLVAISMTKLRAIKLHYSGYWLNNFFK